MREILFRGKAKQDGKWQYGDIVHHDNVVSHIGQNTADGSMEVTELNPETVGQYTGFKDKNGKKVFEGDITKDFIFKRLMVVEFVRGVFVFKAIKKTNFKYAPMWQWFDDDSCEVVGNIYDNPELLNGDANG